jgi:hypothetical protein
MNDREDPLRGELLDTLERYNTALIRMGVTPRVDPKDVARVEVATLINLVRVTADRVATISRALRGIP